MFVHQESISQSVSQGDCSSTGEQDILARALGREEYKGRVRGYGYGIAPTTVFGPKTHVTIPCAQCKVMEAKYDEISKNVAVLMEERLMYKQLFAQSFAAPSLAAPSPAAPSPAALLTGQDSARDSCTPASTQVFIITMYIYLNLIKLSCIFIFLIINLG